MTRHSSRSTLMKRSAAVIAMGVGGVVLATAGAAHADLFTQVTGDHSPGSELTIKFPCGDPSDGTVWLEQQGNEFAITSLPGTVDPNDFTIKLTIPADMQVGSLVSLFGKCENVPQDPVYFGLTESFVIEEGGSLADNPMGSNTGPMLAIATAMVVGGYALLPRRRGMFRRS